MMLRNVTRTAAALVLAAASLTLIGCNTFEGVGADFANLGQGVADLAKNSNSAIDGEISPHGYGTGGSSTAQAATRQRSPYP